MNEKRNYIMYLNMIKNQGGGGGCKWVGGGTSVPLLYRQFYIIDQT